MRGAQLALGAAVAPDNARFFAAPVPVLLHIVSSVIFCGLGAGTQAVTHLPWFLLPEIHGELARTVLMAAGWAINLAVAEWSISHERRRPSS